MPTKAIVTLIFLAIWPIQAVASELFIDLRTLRAPGVAFSQVRVVLWDVNDPRDNWRSITTARAGDNFVAGERVAEFRRLSRGDYIYTVELLNSRLQVVTGRTVRLRMERGNTANIVIIR